MTTMTSWLVPLLVFCFILAALAAEAVYVACYRRRFHRATSSAPSSSTGDCERGLPFSPAWSKCGGGAPSQELLLYQLCVKEHDGWQSGVTQRTTAGPAGPGAGAADIGNGSQPKDARKKVRYASETRNSNDGASVASLTDEEEKSQGVPRFREKYAARFLSPIRETPPPPKEDSSDNGARTSPAKAENVSGDGKKDEGQDEEGPNSFYTPPQSPPWRRSRTSASAYDATSRSNGRGCDSGRSSLAGLAVDACERWHDAE